MKLHHSRQAKKSAGKSIDEPFMQLNSNAAKVAPPLHLPPSQKYNDQKTVRRITTATRTAIASVTQTPIGTGNNRSGLAAPSICYTQVFQDAHGLAAEIHRATPRAMPIVPSVTINGIILKPQITTP